LGAAHYWQLAAFPYAHTTKLYVSQYSIIKMRMHTF